MEPKAVNLDRSHCNVFILGVSSSGYVWRPLVGLPVNKKWEIVLKAEFLSRMT